MWCWKILSVCDCFGEGFEKIFIFFGSLDIYMGRNSFGLIILLGEIEEKKVMGFR